MYKNVLNVKSRVVHILTVEEERSAKTLCGLSLSLFIVTDFDENLVLCPWCRTEHKLLMEAKNGRNV